MTNARNLTLSLTRSLTRSLTLALTLSLASSPLPNRTEPFRLVDPPAVKTVRVPAVIAATPRSSLSA